MTTLGTVLLTSLVLSTPPTRSVVPAALMSGLTAAAATPPLLARVDRCVRELAGATDDIPEGCDLDAPAILGAHVGAGRLAVLTSDTAASCTCGQVGLGLLNLRGAPIGRPTELLPSGICEVAETLAAPLRKAWAGLAALRARGYTPLAELIVGSAQMEAGVRIATPLVKLGGALTGWLIYAHPAGDTLRLEVVPATARRALPLGSLPIERGACSDYGEDGSPDDDEPKCAAWGRFELPTFHSVALTPDRKHLIVALTVSDGTHCGDDKIHVLVYPLPAGVTPL